MTPKNQRKSSQPCKSIYGRLRKTTGYSQEQAAELLDLGLHTLQAYEGAAPPQPYHCYTDGSDLWLFSLGL